MDKEITRLTCSINGWRRCGWSGFLLAVNGTDAGGRDNPTVRLGEAKELLSPRPHGGGSGGVGGAQRRLLRLQRLDLLLLLV